MLPLLTALALAFSSSPEPSSAFLTRPTDGTYDDMASVPREKLNKCSNPDAIPVIVDYDSNIDDVVALSFLAKSPLYDIKAVIITGTAFTNPSIGAANTYRLLELLGLANVDVGIGPYYTSLYWDEEMFPSRYNEIDLSYARVIPKSSMFGADILMGTYDKFLPVSPRHVPAPMGGVAQPKAEDIYEKHIGMGDVRTVLTIGSMTSLHKFQVTYPESFAKIETLYAMFGAVDVDGNVFHSNPIWKAEFNAIADPHSAKAVLNNSTIPNIILVPLDATEEAPMSPEYMTSLATLESHEGRFVSELTHRVRNDWWCESFNPGCFYGFSAGIGSEVTAESLLNAYFFWDPLAVAVMVQPDVVEYEDIQIEIVASMPPDVTIDGWTKRSDTAGRVMKVAMRVPEAKKAVVQGLINSHLLRDCIDNQPVPLGMLMEQCSA